MNFRLAINLKEAFQHIDELNEVCEKIYDECSGTHRDKLAAIANEIKKTNESLRKQLYVAAADDINPHPLTF